VTAKVALATLLVLLTSSVAAAGSGAQRVVSLDYCADQFVLKLLPRERILALSPDADKPFSYMREAAVGLPQVRAVAEDVLVLGPDLIVRSYGGGPNAAQFFSRANVKVLQVPYADSIAGIRTSINAMAKSLSVPERGHAIVAEMDRRLERLRKPSEPRSALYLTSLGATSGPGTQAHDMLLAAGLENYQTRAGWHTIPLERLIFQQPDVIAAAFFGNNSKLAVWSPMRHPVAQQHMNDRPTVMLDGAWTSCGGWFLLDAVEALAALNSAVPAP